MAWRCPACQLAIQHTGHDDRPRPGVRYRCHICRLDLTLDAATNKLTVTPVDAPQDQPPRRSRRSAE